MNLNSNSSPLGKIIIDVIGFINNYLVPLVFALAFLLFLWGVFTYFLAGANDEKRKEGRTFILWGVIAIAIMIAIWGLVNIALTTFGLNNSARPCLPTFGGSGNCTTNVPGGSGGSGTSGSSATSPVLNGPDTTQFGSDPSKLNGPGQPIGM